MPYQCQNMALYPLVNVTNFTGNWYVVLQDSKKILCYPVGWLACTISITLVSKRPIICNLGEIVCWSFLQTPLLLLFRVLVYLIKRIKMKRHYLSCFLNSNEQIMLFDFSPSLVRGFSQGSEKRMCLRGSRFSCFRALDTSYVSKQPASAIIGKSPQGC